MTRKTRKMNKILLISIGLAFLIISVFYVAQLSLKSQEVGSPKAASGALYTQGNKIYFGDGTRFIAEAVNIELYRDENCFYVTQNGYAQRAAIVTKLKELGINAVRINYHTRNEAGGLGVSNGNGTAEKKFSEFMTFMELLADNGIYVMPSDHYFTGSAITNQRSTTFPLMGRIIQESRARGFEHMLIVNPYNEPYGANPEWSYGNDADDGRDDGNDWGDWVKANKEVVDFIRTENNFKGLIVLDTAVWAAGQNLTYQQQMVTYDASKLGGKANIAFANHWYPNIGISSVDQSIQIGQSVPVLIGELGQYNATPDNPQYVKDVLARVVANTNNHNGVFAWMWNWCDSNNMTAAWDDHVNLSTYGKIYPENFYNRVNGGNAYGSGPNPTTAPNATNTPTRAATATLTPTRPANATATPTTQVTVAPTTPPNNTGYPRTLSGSNSELTLVEVKAPENGKVFIEVRPNTSKTITQVDTYVDGRWYSQDNASTFYLGGGNTGAPNGIPVSGTTELRAVAYYNNTWNFIESRVTYTSGGGTPLSSTVAPTRTTSSTPAPTGTNNTGYPREIAGTNSEIKVVETQPRNGNTVYLQAVPSGSKNITQIDWYLNNRWTTYDSASPFYLSSNYKGTNNGFTIPGPGTKIRVIGYINNSWNFVETTITYNY